MSTFTDKLKNVLSTLKSFSTNTNTTTNVDNINGAVYKGNEPTAKALKEEYNSATGAKVEQEKGKTFVPETDTSTHPEVMGALKDDNIQKGLANAGDGSSDKIIGAINSVKDTLRAVGNYIETSPSKTKRGQWLAEQKQAKIDEESNKVLEENTKIYNSLTDEDKANIKLDDEGNIVYHTDEINELNNKLSTYKSISGTLGGGEEQIKAIEDRIAYLEDLDKKSKAVEELGNYEAIVASGDADALSTYKETLSHKNDNMLERTGNATAHLLSNTINEIPTLIDQTVLTANENVANKSIDELENLYRSGSITEEQYINSLAYWNEYVEDYKNAYSDSVSQKMQANIDQLSANTYYGASDIEKFALQAGESTAQFLLHYAIGKGISSIAFTEEQTFKAGVSALREAGEDIAENVVKENISKELLAQIMDAGTRTLGGNVATVTMSLASTADKTNQLIVEGVDANTALKNGLFTGLVSYATEKVGMDRFVEMLGTNVSKDIIGSIIAKDFKNALSEGLEEVVEGLVDPVIDSVTLGTDYEVNGSELLMEFLLGGTSGLMMSVGANVGNAMTQYSNVNSYLKQSAQLRGEVNNKIGQLLVNSRDQYNAVKDEINLLSSNLATMTDEQRNVANEVILKGENAIKNYEQRSQTLGIVFADEMASQPINTDSEVYQAITPDFNDEVQRAKKLEEISNNIDSKVAKLEGDANALVDSTQQILNDNGYNVNAEVYLSLNDKAKKDTLVASDFGKAMGLSVEIVNNLPKGENGYFKDGKIVIDGTKKPVLTTLAHELTHGTESSKYYKDLDKVVSTNYEREHGEGSSVTESNRIKDIYNKHIEEENAKHPERKPTALLTETDGRKEFVAKQIEELLNDESFIRDLVKYNTSIASKIFQDLKTMDSTDETQKIKNMFEKAFEEFSANNDIQYSLDTDYEQAVKNNDLETAQNIVDKVANENGYIRGYHGTYDFGRTSFDKYDVLFLTDRIGTARNFNGGQPLKRLGGTEFDATTSPIKEVIKFVETNTYVKTIREATIDDFNNGIKTWKLKKAEAKKFGISDANAKRFKRFKETLEKDKRDFINGKKFFYLGDDSISNIPNSPISSEEEVREFANEYFDDVRIPKGGGVYDLYFKGNNPISIECDGNYYTDVPIPDALKQYATKEELNRGLASTDQIVRMVSKSNYDLVEFKNLREGGDYGNAGVSNVYAVFDSAHNVKSADPITYDDNGNVIPLSERFNESNKDIRYSIDTNPETITEETDNNGNKLSVGQVEYYKDGKARDKDGKLLTLYTGTSSAGFTEFNDENGIFMTTSKRDADSYGGNDFNRHGFESGRLYESGMPTEYSTKVSTIRDLIENPQDYTLDDVHAAMNAYDYDNPYSDLIREGYTMDDFVESFKDLANQDADALDTEFETQSNRGVDTIHYDKGATYKVYANIKNPYVHYGSGERAESNGMYDALKEARQGDYDGFISYNTKVGRYGDDGTVVVAFNKNQVKLTTNLKPTNGNTIDDVESNSTTIEPGFTTKDNENYDVIREGNLENLNKNEYTNKNGVLKTSKLRDDAGSDFKGTTWAKEFESGAQAVEAIQQGVEEGDSLEYIIDEFLTSNARPIVAQSVAQYLIDNQEIDLAKKVAKEFMNEQLSEAASVLQEGRALKDVNNKVTRLLIVDSMRNNMLLEAEQTFKGDKLTKAKEAINNAFDDNEYAAINADKGRPFRTAARNLWRIANSTLPNTLGGILNRIRYFCMLSGVKTPISNLAANLATTGLYKFDDLNRAIVEKVAKVPQEQRTSTLKLDAKQTKINLDAAEQIWNTEGDTENKYNITGNTNPERIQKKLLSDTGIEKWNFKDKLNLIAQARGIDLSTLDMNSTQANEMIDWALDQAREVVSHNKTALSQFMDNIQKRSYKNVQVNKDNAIFGGLDTITKNIKKAANEGNVIAKSFDSVVRTTQSTLAPFYRTNASVLNKAIEHSPLEVVNLIGDYSKVKNGSMSTTDYFNNLSKCLTGTGIMAISALLSSAGLLRWDKEDEDYSGRLVIEGDNGGYTVDWLDPISNMVARGVMVAQEMAEHGISIEGLTDVIGNEIDMLVNDELSMFNSLMQVATNLKDAVIDKENEYGEYGVGDFAGYLAYTTINQFLPALLRDAARAIYPEQKQVYTDNVLEYVVNRLQNNTLFRDSLDNKTNAQGDVATYTEPYTNNDIVNRIITNFISKGHLVDENGEKVVSYEKGENNNLSEENTELYNELARLNPYVKDTDGYSAEHWLRSSTPSTFYFDNDQSVSLVGDEKTEYGNEWSSIWTTGANSVMSSDLYSTLDDDNKVDVLYKVQSYATGAEAYKYAISHDIVPTDYQKRCNSIIEYCTKNGKLDGDTFALIINATATDNSGKKVVRLTDSNGETIKNSSALLTRKTYEENGIYESLCEMIEENGYDYGDFGLNKTVVKMSASKFETEYEELQGNKTTNSTTDVLYNSYSKVLGSNKATPELNSSSSNKSSTTYKTSASGSKNGSYSTFAKAYSNAMNSNAKSTDSTLTTCSKCGSRVSPINGKCPVCGNEL